MEPTDINNCGQCDDPGRNATKCTKGQGPMPTLPLVKRLDEEALLVGVEDDRVLEEPVAQKEVGVVAVEDGRVLEVVDEEAVLVGIEDGQVLEHL